MIGFMYPAIKAPVSLDIQAKDIAVFALRGGPQITVKKVILTLQRYGTTTTNTCNADINVKPGGGGLREYVGHLTSSALPTLGNLTKNLGPRVGAFAFYARRNGTKSHRPMCSSAAAFLEIKYGCFQLR